MTDTVDHVNQQLEGALKSLEGGNAYLMAIHVVMKRYKLNVLAAQDLVDKFLAEQERRG